MHGTLIFGFCFPLCRHKPWSVRHTPKLCEMERTVQSMWKGARVDGRAELRKFLVAAWKLPSMPKDVVQYVLHFEPRSKVSCESTSD